MKVLITGAHFTPAAALIHQLKKLKDIEIVYVGRKYTREGDKSPSVESSILPKLGVKFISIIAGRLQRSFTRYTIPSLFKIPVGIIQSFYIIITEQPDVVVSFGGYNAVPAVFSSWLLSVPVLIHEQTMVTGLANKISSLFADKIAVSFPGDYSFNKEKTIVTGNPIRQELIQNENRVSKEIKNFIHKAREEKLPIILITGGNQGSHLINEVCKDSLRELLNIAYVVHQTGDSKYKDFEGLQEISSSLPNKNRYLPKVWVEVNDWSLLLREADLCVSRAGVNTLLELALFGVPTIVVPIPYIYKNEQVVNAKFFTENGLSEIIYQDKFNKETLLSEVKRALKDMPFRCKRAKLAKSVVIQDADKRLAQEVLLLSHEV